MSEAPQNPRQVPLGKAAGGTVLAVLLALAGAYVGGGDGIPALPPHPAVVARLDAIDRRLDAIDRRIEDPTPRQELASLAAAVSGLRERIDLWIAKDSRMLAEPPRRR